MGSQVFGVKVEVLLKEESTYRKSSRRLTRAVSLFFHTFFSPLSLIRLRTS